MKYTIEAYDRSGQVFLHSNDLTIDEVVDLMSAALKDPQTGGAVVYRSLPAEEGGGQREGLGLVVDEPPCTFCTERGGHTADCPVIS